MYVNTTSPWISVLSLLPFAIFFIATLFVIPASAEDPTFRSIVGYDINADPAFSVTMNVNAWGQQLAADSLVCIGPVTASALVNSNFTISSATVECPTPNCNAYSTAEIPSSAQPLLTLWGNATYYGSVISGLCQVPSCSRYYSTASAAGVNALTPYVFSATYRAGAVDKGIHPANGSFFCKGNVTVIDNGSPGGTSDLAVSPNVTFTPAAGVHALELRLSTGNCSFMARTYEKEYLWYGQTISPVRDTVHFYTGGTYTATATSPPLNITFTSGPVLSVSQIGTYNVKADEQFTITATVNNTGPMNATITGITLSDGFGVISYNPNTINAGQTVNLAISAKAPDDEGTYDVTMTIGYTSDTPVIGTCGSGTITGLVVANITVLPPGPVPPIDIVLTAQPSLVLRKDDHFYWGAEEILDVNITGIVTRDWPEGDDEVGSVAGNVTIKKFNPASGQWERMRYDLYKPEPVTDQPAHYCSTHASGCNEYSSGLYKIDAVEDDETIIRLRQPISRPVPAVGCTAQLPCSSYWPAGVYSVTANIRDPLAPSVQNTTTYFVILGLGCRDYA